MTEWNSNSSEIQVEPHEQYVSENHNLTFSTTFLALLVLFVRKRRLIGIIATVALLCGVIVSLVLPARYSATTTIMTPQPTQSSAALLMSQLANSGAGQLAAVASGSALGLRNPNDFYIGLLRSRPISDGIIHQFALQAAYHAKDMTATRKRLADNTKIASERSGLISISITDRDPTRAADMANGFTEQLRLLTKRLAVTEASQRRTFYEEQLKFAKDDLVSAEVTFQGVQQHKGIVQPDVQARATIDGLATLHAQIAAKQVEVEALRSYSTERNPEVELAERELVSLQVEAARIGQNGQSTGFGDLGLKEVSSASAQYLRAEHDLMSRQALFDLLLKQYDAARLDEAKDAAVIQVVESALPPERPVSPHHTLIVLSFALLGLIVGIGTIYMLERIKVGPEFAQSLTDFKAALCNNGAGTPYCEEPVSANPRV